MVNRESDDYRRDRNRDEEFRGREFRGGAEEPGRERSRSYGRGYDEGREMQFGREHEESGRIQSWQSGSPRYGSQDFGPQGYRGQSSQSQPEGGYGQSRGQFGRGFSGESGGYGSAGYGSQGYGSPEYGSPRGSGFGEERFGQRFGRGSEGIDRSAGFGGTQGYGQTQGFGQRFGQPSGYSGYEEGRFGPSRTRGRYTGRGPKGYTRSDDRIQEDVNDRLEQHGEIDAWEISVMVQNGEVTLEGTVPDRLTKRLAEDVAEESPGVKQVHNRLRVQGSVATSAETGQSSTASTGTSRTSGGSTTKSSTRT
jgi:hypothetical protein